MNPAIRADLICAEDSLSPHNPRIRYSLTNRGRLTLENDNMGRNVATHGGINGGNSGGNDESYAATQHATLTGM